jgi:hypothetical protein
MATLRAFVYSSPGRRRLFSRDENVPPVLGGKLYQLLELSLLQLPRADPELPHRGQRGQLLGRRVSQVQLCPRYVKDAQLGQRVLRQHVSLQVVVGEERGKVAFQTQAFQIGAT